jgi:hypothetical protein
MKYEYEFLLREPGRPDEIRQSSSEPIEVSTVITIDGRDWNCVTSEPSTDARIRARIICEPVGD